VEYVRLEEVLALHAEIKGVPIASARDHVHRLELLESALERPRNAAAYGDADLVQQAASLLWGLVRSHPFIDGNKRTAIVVTRLFLELNGHVIDMSEDQKFDLVIGIANGGITVDQAADALRSRIRPQGARS
jgi:death-on-curing protein